MTDWRGGLYKARREIIRRPDNLMGLKLLSTMLYSTSIRDLTRQGNPLYGEASCLRETTAVHGKR